MSMKKDLGGIASVKVKFFYAVKDGPTCLKQDEWAYLATNECHGANPSSVFGAKTSIVSRSDEAHEGQLSTSDKCLFVRMKKRRKIPIFRRFSPWA